MSDSRPIRIAVIGAGVSGLTAARSLSDAFEQTGRTIEVVTFEARQRLGGRVCTDRTFGIGADADVGASWIHGASKLNPVYQLMVLQNKVPIHRTNFDRQASWFDENGLSSPGGKRLPDRWLDTSYRSYEKLMDKQESQQEKLKDDISLHEHLIRINEQLYKSADVQFHNSTTTEFDTGISTRFISAKGYNIDLEYPGGDAIVRPGFHSLVELLVQGNTPASKRIDIKTGYAVDKIEAIPSKIRGLDRAYSIHFSNDETYEADFVIISVPLGVLKSKKIEFIPPLPTEKAGAIDRVGFGLVNKVLLKFNTKFWDDYEFFGISTGGEQGLFNYWINTDFVANTKVLIGVALGDKAEFTESNPDEVVIQEAMKRIRVMYPTAPNPIEYRISRWRSEPFSMGSYSFPAVGMSYTRQGGNRSPDWDTLSLPIGQLHFAGEHTDGDYRGTVHGAYRSGLRVAREIQEILQKSR